jgi:putative nucleotidyltransferase with HDIG domain
VSKRSLLVIADEKVQIGLPEIIAGLAVRIVDWRDIGEQSSMREEAAVLIDVDLHDPSKLEVIKEKLPYSVGKQCRIVAIDRRSHQSKLQANSLGASDLIQRPLDIHELKARLSQHFSQKYRAKIEQRLLESAPGAASILSAANALNEIFRAFSCDGPLDLTSVTQAADEVIDAIAEVGIAKWVSMVRNHHQGTFQHCLIVTGVSTAFGHGTGMRRSDVLTLTVAGLLHDVGKGQIPIEILDKPGKLTNEELMIIKRHPRIGYDYLRTENDISSELLDAVLHHHEYLDGSGYPDGLEAHQISDLSRILTVCDTYGALVEQRAYKAANSPGLAMDILENMAKDRKVEYDLMKALRHCVNSTRK